MKLTWMLGLLGVQQAAAVYTTVSPQEARIRLT